MPRHAVLAATLRLLAREEGAREEGAREEGAREEGAREEGAREEGGRGHVGEAVRRRVRWVLVSRPALLLVHGAWHRPEHWTLLTDEMRGVDVHTVALPSSGDDPAALGDLFADAAAIAAAVAAIDGPVVVLAHSAGGVAATQALSSVPNVRRVVYVAAFLPDVGESLLASVGGLHPPNWRVNPQRSGIEVLDAVESFYADVEADLARWAVSRLWRYFSYAAVTQELTEAAWQAIPSTYVICEADSLPLSLQEGWAARTDTVARMNTSHSPFLSQPAELARLIEEELDSA